MSSAKKIMGGNETLLLVEDNTELRSLFMETLTSKWYNVLEASDGTVALEILKQAKDPIQLVITDMVMPKIGGRELFLRASQLDNHIKFIYMSGYLEDIALTDSNSLESLYYLQKPFSEEELLSKVRKVLDS